MDHSSQAPSWVPASAGTGAGPPDLDDDGQPDGATAYAAGPDDADAPGFDDGAAAASGFGQAAPYGPGFADIPAQVPDFGDGQADASGFGAPAVTPAFGDGQQQDQYAGPFTGEFRGDYTSGGFGTAPLHDGPGVGTVYGGEQAYQFGLENGAGLRDASPPFPAQYPPADPPRSRMTASLRAVRRPRLASKKHDRPGRQAQLTVSRIEPWSVMKFSFVISLVAFIVLFVAVAVLYAVLSGLGVFDALQHTVSNITSSQNSSGFDLKTYLSASRVLGYAGLLGAINVVLITALSTVGAVLYNITSDLAGGVEITLKETD